MNGLILLGVLTKSVFEESFISPWITTASPVKSAVLSAWLTVRLSEVISTGKELSDFIPPKETCVVCARAVPDRIKAKAAV